MSPFRRLGALLIRARARPARGRRILAIASAIALLLGTAVLASGVWFVYGVACTLPGPDALRRAGLMDQATTIFDDHDRPVFTIYKEQRIEAPLSQMSPHLLDAIIAIEDQRFFQHHGVDPVRLAGALVANLRQRRAAQGGSTITQQLARQSFLTPDKTLRRKVAELIVAGRLEHLYSKRQILEMYLNRIYFGDGYYGAEAASLGYFGVHASDLSVAQAALLAGLVRSPSSYAPTINRARAIARRNVVLQAMTESGKIGAAQWQAARAEPVVLHNALEPPGKGSGQYFKEQVRRELVSRFGWRRVYEGGLRVFTTLDVLMQRAAETAVEQSLRELDVQRARRRASADRIASRPVVPVVATVGPPAVDPPLQAALVALDPTTGDVRAMVGGRDFADSAFNRAVQARRQPGSAFKPFVYAQALEAGFTPASLIDGLDDPVLTPQGPWTPEDEHSAGGSMTLRAGLRTSSNRAAVRLLQVVGPQRTIDYARAVGLGGLPNVPSLALGSGEVTLLTLTAAYMPFADGGLARSTQLVRRVEDRDGRVLFAATDNSHRALSETDGFLMAQMLADVVDAGTASRARLMGFRLPAAGKTGTTNGFNDAWFIGFTPTLLAGVWVGYDQPKPIARDGYAAEIAVPLWTRFMTVATSGDKPAWFAPPPSVVSARVCRLSGKLAVDGCEHVLVTSGSGDVDIRSMAYTEYFARGTEPTTTCDLHGAPTLLQRLVGLLHGSHGSGSVPPPVAEPSRDAGESRSHEASPATTGKDASQAGAQHVEPPPKKRGFWARLLGIGKKPPDKR